MELPPETIRYLVCKTMGWDYFTYRAQPASFVEEVWAHIVAENQAAGAK